MVGSLVMAVVSNFGKGSDCPVTCRTSLKSLQTGVVLEVTKMLLSQTAFRDFFPSRLNLDNRHS
jgi:exosome complex RNA-binding protein Rrp4